MRFAIYLTILLVIITFVGLSVMLVPSSQKGWIQTCIVILIILISCYYLCWRIFFSLNFDNFQNSVLSVLLLLVEIIAILKNIFRMRLILKVKERHSQVLQMSEAVVKKQFIPSVDVLIPTYNESSAILKKTLFACQLLDYPNKKIYVLDDSKRPEVQELASTIGCGYLVRGNNFYAKAGNLNNALKLTSGYLVAVFDADFIPTTNFLIQTVGFFQESNTALVQTNQSYYNPDPIVRNLGLAHFVAHESEVASRHYQLLRDGDQNAMCYGSSFVVRRDALEVIGGFVKESISEDIFTSICLAAKGYQLVYLDEKLSAGLSAESIRSHFLQRDRGARGSFQSFFIKANPLTMKGLSLSQRLNHVGSLLYWADCIPRCFLLLVPSIYFLLDVVPVKVAFSDFIYFVLPYYFTYVATYSWLNRNSQSYLMADLRSIIYCVPLSISVIKEILNPFSKGFKVTLKGTSSKQSYFNWDLGFPLIIILLLTVSIIFRIFIKFKVSCISFLMALWCLYNFFLISISIAALLDSVHAEPCYQCSFDSEVSILTVNEVIISESGKNNSLHTLKGRVITLSERGMAFEIMNASKADMLVLDSSDLVLAEIIEYGIKLEGKVNCTFPNSEFTAKRYLFFENLTLSQYKQLVKILFCRPDQWKYFKEPNELKIFGLFLNILIQKIKSLCSLLLQNLALLN
jgi:cellulose synthase (UDP-forming)